VFSNNLCNCNHF